MKKILFVCTGNTCRSSMAEALLRHYAAECPELDIIIKSAGTAAFGNQSASRNAVLALQELGIDLTSHSSRQVTDELIEEADLVLTMTNSHKQQLLAFKPKAADKIFTLAEYASEDSGNVADPFGGDLDDYIQCRDEIISHIQKLLHKLDSQRKKGE